MVYDYGILPHVRAERPHLVEDPDRSRRTRDNCRLIVARAAAAPKGRRRDVTEAEAATESLAHFATPLCACGESTPKNFADGVRGGRGGARFPTSFRKSPMNIHPSVGESRQCPPPPLHPPPLSLSLSLLLFHSAPRLFRVPISRVYSHARYFEV